MNGWVLYKESDAEVEPDDYEINRFRQEAGDGHVDLRVVKPEDFELIVSRDDRRSVRLDGAVVPLPDFLLPRMGAGTTYFARAVMRHLERLGVRTFSKSSAIETVMDKLYTQQILAASDLPSARTMLAKFPADLDVVEKYLGFPVVVKPVTGSLGVGVFLAETRQKLQELIDLICATKGRATIILQELVESSYGRDLRVITIGARAIACMKRTAPPGAFKANFSAGGAVEAHELTSEIEWLATEASRIFDLDIAGVDLLFDGDHFKICEVNSAPRFEGMERCHDISIAREILDFIRIRLGMFEEPPG